MILISIVDDEKELRESIATFVNNSPGFRCVSAYNSGEAALKHLPQERPDVVIGARSPQPRRAVFATH